MLNQLLLGLRILVVDDDYFVAQETCRYITGAGAAAAGPLPSNEEALRFLDGSSVVDGVLLKQVLRDGSSDATRIELERRNLPYLFTASGMAMATPRPGMPLLFTPLSGRAPALLVRRTFRRARPIEGEDGEAQRAAGWCET
ncbi:MAG: response regulator receiver protein [Sphingomonas bacterium]|uniref:hypothetical protein n=1 Tax=Sphingomonas bacterium TaxID=1895847 RepID=UPI002635274A|nr:hypothetical protein [Sphingomonas bacterium]MDB5709414.1 response regulator receiver protein [Sphingomonas bacterium]